MRASFLIESFLLSARFWIEICGDQTGWRGLLKCDMMEQLQRQRSEKTP